MAQCDTPAQMRGALDELMQDVYAASSRAPRDALLNTWAKFHEKWFGSNVELLPLTEDKILKISSLFKKGGYKSVKNYFSRVKDRHITNGHEWSEKLDLVMKKCARSVLRGLGGAHRSDQFNFMEVVETTKRVVNPLDDQGPVNPSALVVIATLFMLREVEAVSDVTLTTKSATIKLPVSKVDWQAKGCTRTWSCLCDKQLPCPLRVLEEHGTKDLPLFPTRAGGTCSKQGVVNTIRRAVELSGGAAIDSSGAWRISGRTFRITGAKTLCNWGLDPITIQLIGRWGSSAVLSYLSEAPLEGFHHRIGANPDEYEFDRRRPLNMTNQTNDWCDRADLEGIQSQHNELLTLSQNMMKISEFCNWRRKMMPISLRALSSAWNRSPLRKCGRFTTRRQMCTVDPWSTCPLLPRHGEHFVDGSSVGKPTHIHIGLVMIISPIRGSVPVATHVPTLPKSPPHHHPAKISCRSFGQWTNLQLDCTQYNWVQRDSTQITWALLQIRRSDTKQQLNQKEGGLGSVCCIVCWSEHVVW